jgi:oligopeptidase B
LTAVTSSPPDEPPVARRSAWTHTEHGVEREDPWFWMREESAELLAHLAMERAFYEASCSHLQSLVSTLRSESTSRVPATARSADWARHRFSYYTSHSTGSDYACLLREKRNDSPFHTEVSEGSSPPDDENRRHPEVLLDIGSLADDTGYLDLGLSVVSPDETLLAYSVDRAGDEVFELRFRELTSGTDLDEVILRSYYSGAWSADSSCFFYTVHDRAYRPCEVWRHRLGTPVVEDELVLAEPDERFELTVRLSRSEEAILLLSESRDTGESWYLDARVPDATPSSIGGRRSGIVYRAEHVRSGPLLLVTNDEAVEFRLVETPVPHQDQDSSTWREVRAEDPDERLERVDAFDGYAVLSLRATGRHLIRILALEDLAGPGHDVISRFPTGAVRIARNTSYDARAVAVRDQSYVEPPVVCDIHLATGAVSARYREPVPGYDPSHYVCETRHFPAPDGTAVAATLVRHRDTDLDGSAPALVYGYGAYEYTFEPDWDPALPCLLDRGIVFVHAHVRGGGEGGRRWWLDGRLEAKQNTFTDFCAVADGLAVEALVDGTRIASRGLSAGGLLQAVAFGQRPDRWRAVVAEVPFVDVVTTMFDASIPLTVNEWDEWGDPRRRADFEWLLAYSPFDNLPPAGGRPDLLVTGAVNDPRVMVQEPAKWVAALRASDPSWSPRCVFRCELGAGSHVGPSGRFGHLYYEAEVHAWILDHLR